MTALGERPWMKAADLDICIVSTTQTAMLARPQHLNVTSSLARTRDLMLATCTKLGSKACE